MYWYKRPRTSWDGLRILQRAERPHSIKCTVFPILGIPAYACVEWSAAPAPAPYTTALRDATH